MGSEVAVYMPEEKKYFSKNDFPFKNDRNFSSC